jgi:alkanesulfonate monooxygenase SsuD/methylene tetrahydromethanopterin reductase-like flavin-dependent oxidoreductase (luciferase family)
MMRFGLLVSSVGEHADARLLAEVAAEAEQAGWDSIFLWDVLRYIARDGEAVVDPWIALTAMAMTTERIRLGTLVTPVARRRPWKLARETTSLDRLSNGRLILGVGLGDMPEVEFGHYGEETDNRVRAGKLDEGLEILNGLWSGDPFAFHGEHYQIAETRFTPTPMQQPRIPIWVVGGWPVKRPLQRAARWDGVFPYSTQGALTPADVVEIRAYIATRRTDDTPFDVVIGGDPTATDQGVSLGDWQAAGVTWMIQGFAEQDDSIARLRAIARRGPRGL